MVENQIIWQGQGVVLLDNIPLFEQVAELHEITWMRGVEEGETQSAVEFVIPSAPDLHNVEAVRDYLSSLFMHQGVALLSNLDVQALPAKDWVAENRKQFPPLTVGSFFIYGPYFEGEVPQDKIALKVNAALAFGSGEHETTKGCLLSLERLHARYPGIAHGLDLGCGSGILALAMTSLWDMPVIASDFDPKAVSLAQENVEDNRMTDKVMTVVSDGFDNLPSKKFPLIVANVLAEPLIGFAPDMAAHLEVGGYIILSGLLDRQADDVLKAYYREGLECVDRLSIGGWSTLTLSWQEA